MLQKLNPKMRNIGASGNILVGIWKLETIPKPHENKSNMRWEYLQNPYTQGPKMEVQGHLETSWKRAVAFFAESFPKNERGEWKIDLKSSKSEHTKMKNRSNIDEQIHETPAKIDPK